MSNLSAPLPVMAGEDMPAGPTDPIFNRLLKDRIIWMGEEVKDEMANRICAQMLMLAAEDPKKDIWLYINSPGGSITAGMAIYDTMQLIEPDVATVGLGMCASMGQFLLSSGTKGKRFLTSHARVLMHQPSGGIALFHCTAQVGKVVHDENLTAGLQRHLLDAADNRLFKVCFQQRIAVKRYPIQLFRKGIEVSVFIGIAELELFVGQLEVQIQYIVSPCDAVSYLYGKDGLAHIGIGKEAG